MDNPLKLNNLKADLGGKPVWFWGLIGGVFVLSLYYVIKSKKAATVAGSLATGQASVADTLSTALPTVDYAPGGVYANTGSSLGSENIETRESWTGRAIIIGRRYGHSAIFMTNAINKYIAGKPPLTQAEAKAINEVIGEIGLPPGGQTRAIQIAKTVAAGTKTNTGVNDTAKTKTVVPSKPAKPAKPAKPVKPANPVTPTAPGGKIDPRDAGRFPGWWAATHPTKGTQV